MHPNDFTLPDPLTRRFLMPARIVWTSEGPNAPKGANGLLEERGVACQMRYAAEGAPPALLVDFGREIHGGIEIRQGIVSSHDPVRVRINFGESVAEAMGSPNQDHAIHESEALVPWYGSLEFGNTGFRFARIEVLDKGAHLELDRCRAILVYRNDPYTGTFRCSDPLLERIWNTGAYTVHLCMQEHLWDGIKRDRLVWIGDMHPETMVINTVFGAHPVVPKSLDYVRDNTPLPGWMNGISSYSLWWIRIHHSWYQYHGNLDDPAYKSYLDAQRPYLLGLLDQLFSKVGDDGREHLDGGRFLDWPTSEDKDAVHIGLQALLTLAFDEAAVLCTVLGESGAASRCRDTAKRMRGYTPPATKVKQSAALIALAGYGKPEEVNRAVLADNPLKGISTFYGYYVLQARALAGDVAGGLHVIRNYWKGMFDMGATTFWEDFNLDWMPGSTPVDEIVPEGEKSIHTDYGDYCYKGLRHSLCHGWASGPTAWLTEHVLGVRPAAPGCTAITVTPHLEDLEFAEGTFPTIHGPVHIKHTRKGGTIDTEVQAPDGVRVLSESESASA